jgi:16S rRNA (cytosine1402-N4)-methyltransferase
MRRPRRSTPAGQHRAVLLDQVLAALDVRPGDTVVDCTIGWAGHSCELLRLVGPTGRLFGLDLDAENLDRARPRLEEVGHPFSLHHANFAGIAAVLGAQPANAILADLGMASMQVDDPGRGFSYAREGPLDMRMDRSRGRTALELLKAIHVDELSAALRELGDEPDADTVAAAITAAARAGAMTTTTDLARVVQEALKAPQQWKLRAGPAQWKTHPAARTFQTLRILVNRELANLQQLLRVLPAVLAPGGRAAIISFHSGEDRLVKSAFRDGLRAGVYVEVSEEPVRAGFAEKQDNPRSRSAKLRRARRAVRPGLATKESRRYS